MATTAEAPAGLDPGRGAAVSAAWAELVSVYLAQVHGRSGSLDSLVNYRSILGRFLALHDPGRASPTDVAAWCYGVGAARPPGASTIRQRIGALRGLYRLAVASGLVGRSPVEGLRLPTRPRALPRALELVQVRAILGGAAVATRGERRGRERGLRLRAFVLGLILTGLRAAELLRLTAGVIRAGRPDEEGDLEVVIRCKGGRERPVVLPGAVLRAVEAMLEARGVRGLDGLPDGAVVWGLESKDGLRYELRKLGRVAGLRLTAHVLRHTAARLQRDQGAELEDVQQLLGHDNLATTDTYLRACRPARKGRLRAVERALGLGPTGGS